MGLFRMFVIVVCVLFLIRTKRNNMVRCVDTALLTRNSLEMRSSLIIELTTFFFRFLCVTYPWQNVYQRQPQSTSISLVIIASWKSHERKKFFEASFSDGSEADGYKSRSWG